MVKVVPVTAENYAGKGWRHPNGYGFVAAECLAPVGALELVNVVVNMPVALVKEPWGYVCVALTGLEERKNLFVGPRGQWLGKYVPAAWRAHPFSLRTGTGGQLTLCFDEDSGLLVDELTENVEKFFDADGSLSAATTAVAEFLRQYQQDRVLINGAISGLADARVIVPWPINVPVGNSQVTIEHLHRVDETKLNGISDEEFLKLRKTSSLLVAFAQLLSMAQIGTLAQLAVIERQMALVGQQPGPAIEPPV
jgi:hypothetical protein